MRLLLVPLVLLVAGCVETPEPQPTPAAGEKLGTVEVPQPTVLEWEGAIAVSEFGALMHGRPSEDVLWPVQQEGFILDVAALPEVMEVALEWDAPEGSEFMIMLHSHKAEGTNAYKEHITEMDAQNPKCLRVPTADLVEGHWQVMIHQQGADGATFALKVVTVGGSVAATDERHGHWFQDGAFEVEEREIEPCSIFEVEGA